LTNTRTLTADNEIIAYPTVQPTAEFYDILPLLTGEQESTQPGWGHDLYRIRDYQNTDNARHIDWKATARTQAMKVREFTRENERRVEIVFDPFLPPEAQSQNQEQHTWNERFERAVNFCACLTWHFFTINAQMKFRSPTFSTRLGAASDVVYPALRALALIQPCYDDTPFLHALGEKTGEAASTFKVLLTARPPGTLPTSLWNTSYVVFMRTL